MGGFGVFFSFFFLCRAEVRWSAGRGERRSPECGKVGRRAGSPRRDGHGRARVCRWERGAAGGVCVEVCVGDIRDPGETSASHRLGEPVRVFLK